MSFKMSGAGTGPANHFPLPVAASCNGINGI
jgi:hypothetical protein